MKSIISAVALCVALGGCVSDDEYNMKGMTYDQKVSYLQFSANLNAQNDARDEIERHNKAMEAAQSDRDFQMQSLNDDVSNLNQQIQRYNDNH